MTYLFSDWKGGQKPPNGWDCANAIEDGWTRDDLEFFMKATVRPWTPPPSTDDAPPERPAREHLSSAGTTKAVTATAPVEKVQSLAFKRRPVIQHVDCELPNIVTMAADAATNAGAELYARGTSLVRPVTIHSATASRGIKRSEGSTVLVPVEKSSLVEILTGLIDFRRYDARKDDWKQVACPPIIAETMLARRGDWPFPQLSAVVSAPTMRPDGTILNAPGFDLDTGILFATELTWPKVPDRPTIDDAKAAIVLLRDLISSFPFVSPSDHAAALSMIFTALVRPCLASAPMFGVNAPTPGTGKSKLVDIAAVLSTGQSASVLSATREEAEMQKQIGAALMAGDPFITIDNIEYPLRSEFLCQTLTQGHVTVRVLGESRTMKLPTGSTFCATGNSLRFAGDLTRRVVLINLDAGIERPEERVFKTDVVAVAKARRVELVIAALTILRAFLVHRGPKIVPALGSFESWSNLVRSALMWVGEADPLSNSEKVRENDPERERTSAILFALPAGEDWTAADIGRMLQHDRERGADLRRHEALADALAEFTERNGQFNAVRFGHFLRKHAGRIVDGRRIVNCGIDRKNVVLWTIDDLSEPGADQF
ncbi:hypothetical protein [Rhizobium rhizogenes]|uniref:hypothetical protein n=1 Tax=Rhizobium rhizogenes TaxID=359 RepID=UPI00157364C5|nr:hypothetical protein [Rhizobium rhizogenes]NTI35568.1 hypothetical protein [Rhizobium rhizogenes]WEO63545.1 hypothetical protein G6L54_010585 [Rhizobium rhizogenes]